jgi:hypothetical protein
MLGRFSERQRAAVRIMDALRGLRSWRDRDGIGIGSRKLSNRRTVVGIDRNYVSKTTQRT